MTRIFCDECGGDVGNPWYTDAGGRDLCRKCYERLKASGEHKPVPQLAAAVRDLEGQAAVPDQEGEGRP